LLCRSPRCRGPRRPTRPQRRCPLPGPPGRLHPASTAPAAAAVFPRRFDSSSTA
jgi:hypothetical protein